LALPTFAACFPGAIAQLGERYNGIVEVTGSIPVGSTNKMKGFDGNVEALRLFMDAFWTRWSPMSFASLADLAVAPACRACRHARHPSVLACRRITLADQPIAASL
jgi:hypothetical protein